jgi:hypothetical protein
MLLPISSYFLHICEEPNARMCLVHFPKTSKYLNRTPPLYGLGVHNDFQPFELFGFIILEDVSPKSGGTCIWPTSPHRLYECVDHEQSYGFHPNEAYGPTLAMTLEEVSPVEFVGKAGDVMFLHPQMLHSAGIHSATQGSGQLRIATVMEWQRARPEGQRTLMWTLNDGSRALPALDPAKAMDQQPTGFFASGNGAGNGSLTNVRSDRSFAPALDGRDPASEADQEVYIIHHHDAAEFLPGPAVPKPGDMWQNWAFNSNADEPPNIVDELPWWERHNIKAPQTIYKLCDIASLGEHGRWRLDDQVKAPVPAPIVDGILPESVLSSREMQARRTG